MRGLGEGATLVTEQLGLEQRLGNGSAVDGHEWLAARGTRIVNSARDQLLPGACLTDDEHRRQPAVGDLARTLDRGTKHRTLTDNTFHPEIHRFLWQEVRGWD